MVSEGLGDSLLQKTNAKWIKWSTETYEDIGYQLEAYKKLKSLMNYKFQLRKVEAMAFLSGAAPHLCFPSKLIWKNDTLKLRSSSA